MSQLRIGINGLGRIGRLVFRLGFDSLNIVAVNGRSSVEMTGHLLNYDSVHGKWDKKVEVKDNSLQIKDRSVAYFNEKDPASIPWDKHNVDLVIECTGVFKKREDLEKHLSSKVQKVIISAPAEGAEMTLVFGVNHLDYKKDMKLISNASCTTNCLAPLIKVLNDSFQIEKGHMTTVHSYTNDQSILDSSHKTDFRRARACHLNMIPTSTGAGKALDLIFPKLKGCIQGSAIRVPTANVSLVDLCVEVKKSTSAKEVNQKIKIASQGELKNILAVTEEPLVSSDFNGRRESSIVDLLSTKVLKSHLIRVLSWYDNEAGYSQRIIDFIHYLEKR